MSRKMLAVKEAVNRGSQLRIEMSRHDFAHEIILMVDDES